MSFRNLTTLAGILLFAPIFVFGQIQPPYDMSQPNKYAYEMRSYPKAPADNGKGVGEEYDLKYHRFNWFIDPSVSYIAGSVTSYFQTISTPFSHVRFELSSYLSVDSVIYAGGSVSFTHSSDVLDINIGTNLAGGTLDSLTVYYQGNPDAGIGFGSFIQDTHNLVPIIWTLSEPYGTKDWWPCKNILSDKIDSIDVWVTCPDAYRTASNGILADEFAAGGFRTCHWKHRYPIAAYLIAIAVTNFAVYSDFVPLDGDTLEMLNYVFPEDLAAFQAGTAAQVEVLQFYDSIYGDYPYMGEKYGHAQFKWGGGMEHQTMSFVINPGYDLLAHEMAHQWYGDKVTCGSWQDIWVNEGFATYSQGLTLEFLNGGYWFPFWLHDRINSITSLPDGSVFCYDTSSVSRVFDWRLSYQKGAMVLHMLRWLMGDTVFFQGMKDIIADPNLAYGYAKTPDIEAKFENASGLNLNEFFTDWIYREGHPVYTIYATVNQADSSVQLSVYQTPSHSSVSYFELPVPIQFKNATHDTILVFNNTFDGQSFIAHPGFMTDSIFFDPDMHLLAQLDTIMVGFTSSINDSEQEGVHFRPNPAESYIEILDPIKPASTIYILDLSGRILMEIPAGDSFPLRINISRLPEGMYLLKISSKDNIASSFFVKN